MAANIYGNGTTTATAGANTITHYYDRAGINAANRVNIYQQFIDRKSMPQKYGKTFKISRFEHMYDRSTASVDFATKGFLTSRDIAAINASLGAAVLAEGAGAVNIRTLQKVTFETQFNRYGEMIDYTDEVDIWSEDYIQVKYREELGELANSRMEDLIQRDMLSTTTVIYSGAAASMATIATGVALNGSTDDQWTVSYDLIRKSVRKLVRNRAKKTTSIITGACKIGTSPVAKAYYAIIGADVKSDLETLVRGTSYATKHAFIPAHEYASTSTLADGEVGAMHEVRFIEAESAAVYRQQGSAVPAGYFGSLQYTGVIGTTAAFDVFPILFPTEGAFASVGLKGLDRIKFNSKSPAALENGNPYGTTGFFSYNFFYAGIILREEALLKVLVAAKN